MAGNDKPGTGVFRRTLNALKSFADSSVRPIKIKRVALNAVNTAGGVFAFQPGVACLVERVILDVQMQSSGACTVDAGVAANATTLSDTLIDGVSVAAAGPKDNIEDKGTNGKARQVCSASQWITGSVASGASAGLVGFAYLHYVETATV